MPSSPARQATSKARSVKLHWCLQTTASLRRTWDLLSDTDRFNRVAGKDDSYEEHAMPDGRVERTGTMRRVGIKLRWHEAPFEWHAPHHFAVQRTFHGGPATGYELRLDLSELADGGTEINYRVDVHPRMTVTRPAVVADARLFTRPGIDRALRRAVAVLDGDLARFDDPPPALTSSAESLLNRGLSAIDSRAVATRLGHYLRDAPLIRQQQLAPLQLARRWGLPDAEVLLGFVQAVAAGVLSLSWELRCPSCRVAKGRAPRLGAGPSDVHCASCNLPFDGSLPDNLLVGFRPDMRIRHIDIPIRCIGSPARTPHVVAQHRLMPQQTTLIPLVLLAGTYRLRTFPATSTVSLQVRADVRSHGVVLQARRGQLSPGLLRLAPGRSQLHIRTLVPTELTLVVERIAAEPYTLTAGRMLEFADVRAAIPAQMLHPDLAVEVQRGVVIAARIGRGGEQARQQLERALSTWQPRSILARTDSVVALFDDAERAMSAASLLEGALHLGAGMTVGTVVLRIQGEQEQPCGGVVDRCLALAGEAAGGLLLLGDGDAADPEIAQLLQKDGVTAQSPAQPQSSTGQLPALTLHLAHPTRTSPPLSILVELPQPQAGLRIDGRYTLVRRIGDGGFGTAWLSRDEQAQGQGQGQGQKNRREVVIKLLHSRLANDPVQVQRFFNEGRLVQDIDSPWIAQVYDYGRGSGGHLFVAMEFLHGEELWQYQQREGLIDPRLACALCIDILRGLQDAHAAGLVHRDIKPSNIFLTAADSRTSAALFPRESGLEARPVARIIDFGVAYGMAAADPRLTLSGHAIGTPHYMAPEQVECRVVDGRTDLYALASLLYECLSGTLPFEGDNSIALLMARLNSVPKPLDEVMNTPLPPALVDVVMAALARDPANRPADAATMRAQLESARVQLPLEPDNAWSPTRRRPAAEDFGADVDTEDCTPSQGS